MDLDHLRQLPVAERLQLVEDLWDTIAEEAPDEPLPLSPELVAELDRRSREHQADPSAARPWAEVRADILPGRRRSTRSRRAPWPTTPEANCGLRHARRPRLPAPPLGMKRGLGPLSADTALRLARYFGTTERFRLNVQARYDLELERDRLGPRLEKEVRVLFGPSTKESRGRSG